MPQVPPPGSYVYVILLKACGSKRGFSRSNNFFYLEVSKASILPTPNILDTNRTDNLVNGLIMILWCF